MYLLRPYMLLGARVCEEPVPTPWCSNSTLGRFSSRQRRFLIITECCLIFRIDGLHPQHLASERWRFFNPLSADITKTTFCFLLSLESREERRRTRSSPLTMLNHKFRVSQPALLCPCDCNCLKGTPRATTDTIVLHLVKLHLNRSSNVVHRSL